MKSTTKIILATLVALSACKHTGASTNDAAAKNEEIDAGTSTGMSASDAGTSSSMSTMSADAGASSMTSGSMGTSTSPSGVTTAADAAKTASANGTSTTLNGSSSTMTAAPATTAVATPDAGTSSADAGSSAKLSDAQIAGITAAAHQSEIDAAKMARTHSKNAKVRAFAAKMIKDHTAAMKAEKALGITPEDSDQSTKIKSESSDAASKLDSVKGRDFDKQYVAAQVDAHQKVLDMIDNTLLPAAQDEKLKAQLQKERPTVAAHLEHAQKLAASIGAK